MDELNQVGVQQNVDPALEKAAEILQREDEAVVRYMMELMNSSNSGWEENHISSALGIVSEHVKGLHAARKFEVEVEERSAASKQFPYLLGLGFAGAIGLSWLFLEYEQAEYIVAILTGVFGFAGGLGVAKSKGK